MSDQKTIDERLALPVLDLIELAQKEVAALNHGKRWRMQIPVDVDDSDLVISGALAAARKEIERLRGLSAARGGAPAVPSEAAMRIRSLLETYGEHLTDCTRPDVAKDEGCTCGFATAIRVAREWAPYERERGSLAPAPSGHLRGVASVIRHAKALVDFYAAPWAGQDRITSQHEAKLIDALSGAVARLAVPGEGTKT